MELAVGDIPVAPSNIGLLCWEVPDWAINAGGGMWVVLWLPPPRNCWLGFQFGWKQSWFCPCVGSLEASGAPDGCGA